MVPSPVHIEKKCNRAICKRKDKTVKEGQETADTCKACQPFLPLSSTVLFGRFPLAKCPHRTPLKIGVKLGGYPYCKLLHTDYKSVPITSCFTEALPGIFPWFL